MFRSNQRYNYRTKYIRAITRYTSVCFINIDEPYFSLFISFFYRDSALSDSETTTDLSDKNCTGEELDFESLHNLPKVVSQSTGVGGLKRPVNSVDQKDLKRAKHEEVRTRKHHSFRNQRFLF